MLCSRAPKRRCLLPCQRFELETTEPRRAGTCVCSCSFNMLRSPNGFNCAVTVTECPVDFTQRNQPIKINHLKQVCSNAQWSFHDYFVMLNNSNLNSKFLPPLHALFLLISNGNVLKKTSFTNLVSEVVLLIHVAGIQQKTAVAFQLYRRCTHPSNSSSETPQRPFEQIILDREGKTYLIIALRE